MDDYHAADLMLITCSLAVMLGQVTPEQALAAGFTDDRVYAIIEAAAMLGARIITHPLPRPPLGAQLGVPDAAAVA